MRRFGPACARDRSIAPGCDSDHLGSARAQRQDEDPALPKCTVDECFGGKCTWHDAAGAPRVNAHRFPDMKALVDYGHSLGLKVGGYLNTCICTEAGQVPRRARTS